MLLPSYSEKNQDTESLNNLLVLKLTSYIVLYLIYFGDVYIHSFVYPFIKQKLLFICLLID